MIIQYTLDKRDIYEPYRPFEDILDPSHCRGYLVEFILLVIVYIIFMISACVLLDEEYMGLAKGCSKY
ncbi:MAG: hypothetical protein ACFFDN_28165 [Candidatus Hodarchaeota archaeon]